MVTTDVTERFKSAGTGSPGRRLLGYLCKTAPLMALAAAAVAGCTGSIGNSGGSGGDVGGGMGGNGGVSGPGGGNGGGGSGGTVNVDCVETASPRLLRQLTLSEYTNTVTDLLHVTNPDTTNIPADIAVRDFTNNVTGAFVDDSHMSAYQSVGSALATRAINESYTAIVPCQTQDTACATTFVNSFGQRAFRRPLAADETARYVALFDSSLTGGTFKTGVGLAINAMLISPYFLFRSELGTDMGQGKFVLTPYEIATALSYTYWGTMPDAALFASAQSGALANKTEIQAQASRLLADPRGRAQVANFFYQWLESPRAYDSTKDVATYPKFTTPSVTTEIVNAMRGEEDAFIKNVVFDSTKSFDELFTANYTFVNDTLAAYYGFPLPGTGATFTKVPIPSGSDRGGLLTLGMFLFGHARTNESSPTQRGHVIRANFFCQDIPPPPAGVNPVVMDGTPGKTAREQILALTSTGICVNCHSLQDPIGFGLEGFGGDALQRAMDNGEAVDTSGTINKLTSHPSGPITFNGPKDLAQIIATSDQAKACLPTNLYRYARGFDAQAQVDSTGASVDACAMQKLGQSFVQGNVDIPGLFLQVALQDSFTARRSAEVVAR